MLGSITASAIKLLKRVNTWTAAQTIVGHKLRVEDAPIELYDNTSTAIMTMQYIPSEAAIRFYAPAHDHLVDLFDQISTYGDYELRAGNINLIANGSIDLDAQTSNFNAEGLNSALMRANAEVKLFSRNNSAKVEVDGANGHVEIGDNVSTNWLWASPNGVQVGGSNPPSAGASTLSVRSGIFENGQRGDTVKIWARYVIDGSNNVTIQKSRGISSITSSGGVQTINFSNTRIDINYVAIGTLESGNALPINTRTTTYLKVTGGINNVVNIMILDDPT